LKLSLLNSENSVRAKLVASRALAYYGEIVPMAASIFSEPALLARHREGVRKRGQGPGW